MSRIHNADVNRILLATDFSRWTAKAVDYAFDMAACFQAEILMVHGIEPIANAAVDHEEEDGNFNDFFGELTEKSRQNLEELVARAEERGLAARFHIEIGERWRIILDHAKEEDVDLIVLGRRAYDEEEDVPLGTTSQRVFFGAHRPVMTVPSEQDTADGDGGEE